MDPHNYEAGAAAAPPAEPPNPSVGYPTAGNPATGAPATKPGPYWFYKIGESLRNVITGAGLTPDDGDLTQLSVAIKSLSLTAIQRPTKASTNVINVAGTNLTISDPMPGNDYFFSLTAITATKQTDSIGGFHYSLTPASEVPTGNKTATDIAAISGINEYSIWTNWFRPTCDPASMVHVNGRWYDIYLLNSEHITNGSSKAGATIAGGNLAYGRSYPKIPLEFGGTGATNYGKLTWFIAAEIAASHGKSLISYAEFPSIAYGVIEQTDASGLDSGTANIEHYAGLTSKFGIEQATGTQWIWGADVGGNRSENSTSWAWRTGLTDARGSIYALHNNHVTAALFGGGRGHGVYSGSRASAWTDYVWDSDWHIGVRLACDHLMLDE